jgi:hypothetical protein
MLVLLLGVMIIVAGGDTVVCDQKSRCFERHKIAKL